MMICCIGCDGKKFVNHVKIKSNGVIITKSRVIKCLKCDGKGRIDNGIISKN